MIFAADITVEQLVAGYLAQVGKTAQQLSYDEVSAFLASLSQDVWLQAATVLAVQGSPVAWQAYADMTAAADSDGPALPPDPPAPVPPAVPPQPARSRWTPGKVFVAAFVAAGALAALVVVARR